MEVAATRTSPVPPSVKEMLIDIYHLLFANLTPLLYSQSQVGSTPKSQVPKRRPQEICQQPISGRLWTGVLLQDCQRAE
jgi:hypothetical protein